MYIVNVHVLTSDVDPDPVGVPFWPSGSVSMRWILADTDPGSKTLAKVLGNSH